MYTVYLCQEQHEDGPTSHHHNKQPSASTNTTGSSFQGKKGLPPSHNITTPDFTFRHNLYTWRVYRRAHNTTNIPPQEPWSKRVHNWLSQLQWYQPPHLVTSTSTTTSHGNQQQAEHLGEGCRRQLFNAFCHSSRRDDNSTTGNTKPAPQQHANSTTKAITTVQYRGSLQRSSIPQHRQHTTGAMPTLQHQPTTNLTPLLHLPSGTQPTTTTTNRLHCPLRLATTR